MRTTTALPMLLCCALLCACGARPQGPSLDDKGQPAADGAGTSAGPSLCERLGGSCAGAACQPGVLALGVSACHNAGSVCCLPRAPKTKCEHASGYCVQSNACRPGADDLGAMGCPGGAAARCCRPNKTPPISGCEWMGGCCASSGCSDFYGPGVYTTSCPGKNDTCLLPPSGPAMLREPRPCEVGGAFEIKGNSCPAGSTLVAASCCETVCCLPDAATKIPCAVAGGICTFIDRCPPMFVDGDAKGCPAFGKKVSRCCLPWTPGPPDTNCELAGGFCSYEPSCPAGHSNLGPAGCPHFKVKTTCCFSPP